MKIKVIGIILLAAITSGPLNAHTGKPRYHVIIDTDGALDDMRSISMFLSGNDIRVLAITCSEGTLHPDSVYCKTMSLLSAFHHEGIPVGIGKPLNLEPPAWSTFAGNIQWAEPVIFGDLNFKMDATGMLHRAVENYPDKITLIALGSLKTYADWIRSDPGMTDKIERIVWYNHHHIEDGFNYLVSPDSYEYIKQTGIQLDIVSNQSAAYMVNKDYLASIREAGSIYARQIGLVHTRPAVVEKINQEHLYLLDDLVALYLSVPILFETETRENVTFATPYSGIPENYIFETIARLLASANVTNNRVFVNFPVDEALYKPEYAKILNSTIEAFGPIEWKAVAMTNEIHGHTGIYSIIGAKMGIRAMEYFNVGVNNLSVTTFAGSTPPLSCFNDGVQISTGSTIGQGLINVSDSISAIPSALFEFNGQVVHISLKPEFTAQIQNDIRFGVQNYGLLSAEYWLYIEDLGIRYWATFDRDEIFDFKAGSQL
jgi:pyrimidine-specific ribonucleoside hydrolase